MLFCAVNAMPIIQCPLSPLILVALLLNSSSHMYKCTPSSGVTHIFDEINATYV